MKPKDCAVRVLLEYQDEQPQQWKVIGSIREQLGVHHVSPRLCGRGAGTDAGFSSTLTADEWGRLKELEGEDGALKQGSEFPKSASVFFATELDSQNGKRSPI